MGDVPPDDPGVAPPFHNLEVDEDGVATPAGIDTSTEAVTALADRLSGLSYCPTCRDAGWYVEPDPSDETGATPMQVQCQCAHPDSPTSILRGAADALAALVAERDEARAVLAAVPEDLRRLAEAVVAIEASGVLPEGSLVEIDDHLVIRLPGGAVIVLTDEVRGGRRGWSSLIGMTPTAITVPTAVEAVRAALAAARVEAPVDGTDGGA